MLFEHQRKLKNFLINRSFQIQFLLRFFLFTFILLSLAGIIQFFVTNRTVLNELANIRMENEARREIISDFLKTINAMEKRDALHPEVKKVMSGVFSGYNEFIKSEIATTTAQINRANSILGNKAGDLWMGALGSIFGVGILVNLLLSFLYGIVYSHRIAGNHYRLMKFAKQLQEGDFATPLIVRGKDYFKETAAEFEKARIILKSGVDQRS